MLRAILQLPVPMPQHSVANLHGYWRGHFRAATRLTSRDSSPGYLMTTICPNAKRVNSFRLTPRIRDPISPLRLTTTGAGSHRRPRMAHSIGLVSTTRRRSTAACPCYRT
jgi:hypothetical protein